MYINILQLTFYEALNNIRPPQPSRPLPSIRQDEDALLQRYMYIYILLFYNFKQVYFYFFKTMATHFVYKCHNICK